MKLRERVVLVAGGGQRPGETIGNGRAAAITFAREGARVLVTDVVGERAESTVKAIRLQGGEAEAMTADVTREDDCRSTVSRCIERWGRLDVLHYNVGIVEGDASPLRIEREAWDRILAVNTTGFLLMVRHALPPMREAGTGVILAVSSIAAWWSLGSAVGYKASKAALNAVVHSVAMANARYGIRANAILPGLMDTPIAIETMARALGITAEEARARRNAQVPLGARMGTAWDVANAALFLASDDARFITGVMLPVDGGQSARVG